MSSTASGSASPSSTEVDYPVTFAPNQAPAHLDYVCALNGVAGPGRSGRFHYCELGCGIGKTVNVLAAAYPEAEFLGIDLSARHIEAGEAMAAAGGLDNAHFLAADIVELDLGRLADFDFITMEGLYTWVPAEVRRAINGFIAAKLRPGGLVHVSYNTLPGWGVIEHMRQYFLDRGRILEGEPTQVARRILDEIETMRKERAPFFVEHPAAASMLEKIREADPHYVVHEFFTPSWRPMAFAEVNREMAGAGLVFVGDGRVVHNFIEHAVPEAMVPLARAMEDRLSQERTKDFIINRFFRSDVYVRPPGDGTQAPSADALLSETVFGMMKTPAELSNTIEIPLGRIELKGTSVELLKSVLASECLSLAEILDHPALRDCPPEELVQSVKLLSMDRQVAPFARRAKAPSGPPPKRIGCPLTLNRAFLDEPITAMVVLASPTAGTGVSITPLDACLLLGLMSEDPVATAAAEARKRSLELTQAGKPLESSAELHAAFENLLPQYSAGRLPKLATLGVIDPW